MGVLACDEDSPTIPEEPTPVEYEKPFLQKPAAGDSIYLPYTFDWASRHDYSSYRLQISDDTSFTNLLYDTDVGENLRYAPEADLPEGIMHWRVGGVEEDTVVWSETWPFLLYELRPLYQSRSCNLTIHGIDFLMENRMTSRSILYYYSLTDHEYDRLGLHGSRFEGSAKAFESDSTIRGYLEIDFEWGTDVITKFKYSESKYRRWMPKNLLATYQRWDTLRISVKGAWRPANDSWVYELRGETVLREYIDSYHYGSEWWKTDAFWNTSKGWYSAGGLLYAEDAYIRIEFNE